MSQVGYGLALSSSDVDFEIFEVLGTTVASGGFKVGGARGTTKKGPL